MVSSKKVQEVESLVSDIRNYKTIVLADFTGIPSSQFQKIRKNLRKDAKIRVSKNTLIKRAFEKTKIPMTEYVSGNTALIFSNLNPFKINKLAEENTAFAPPKPNSIAEEDIIVKSGTTPFGPGPMVAEMQKLKIKAQIRGGKVIISEDSVVAKKGEKISPELSSMLGKLGITPVKVGLKIKSAYDGILYHKDVLRIDVEAFKSKIALAQRNAIAVAIERCIYNKTSIIPIIQKIYMQSKYLAIERAIASKETIKDLIIKANYQAAALKVKEKILAG